MKSALSNILIFTVGAAIGSVVTWKLIKNKYEQIAKEEIDSVKEVFSRRKDEIISDEKRDDDFEEYHNITSLYSKESDEEEDEDEDEDEDEEEVQEVKKQVKKPYVISPDEFGEMDEYDAISLNYYADGVLTNDWDEVIENVDDIVGIDSLNHFGEYEEDSVFVRNDTLQADYEILKDVRNYSDVVDTDPHSAEE